MEMPGVTNRERTPHWVIRGMGQFLVFMFLFACLLCAALLVYSYFLLPPYWDKTFGQLDERFYFAPQAFFLDTSLQNGEFPLWNPLAYCGMPFAGDPQASACYPPQLIRSFLTPPFDPHATTVSLHVLRFLHLLLAGLGVLFLAGLYGLSVPARLVGAFAFMFNAFNIIYFTEFYVYALVIVWAPWVLWAAKSTFIAQRLSVRIAYASTTVLFYALSTLAGFPQLSLYLGLLLGFYGLFDFLLNHKWTLQPMNALRATVLLGKRMTLVAVITTLTILAAAVLLLPAVELGSTSARVVSAGVEVASVTQNFNPLHLLKCLLFFPGNTWLPLGPRAVGIGSLLAALVAIGHQKRRDVVVFFILYLILTDCTLGPPFPIGWLLHRVDILNITVSPWRAGSFAALPFALLAAFGVDAAGCAPARYWARAVKMLILAVAGGGMLFLLRAWLLEDILHQKWYFVWQVPFAALLAMCLFSWLPLPRLGRWIIALLVAAEILLWSAQMLPAYVSKRVAITLDTNTFGEHRHISCLNRRRADVRPNWNMFTLDFSMAGYNPLYVGKTRETLCRIGYENFYRGYLKGDDVTVENQRGNRLVKRSFWLARQWVSGNLPDKTELFPVSTTVFLANMPEHSNLLVPQVDRMRLSESAVSEEAERIDLGVPDATKVRTRGKSLELTLPAYDQNFTHSALLVAYRGTGVVEFTPQCKDEEGRVHLLRRCRAVHTHGQERYLEIPLPDCKINTISLIWPRTAASQIQLTRVYALKDRADEGNRILIEKYSANSVSLKLNDLPGPRILVFLDSWYPGWRAWVDGNEVPILKANDAFKAVEVPAGTHQVYFKYQSRTTIAGFFISVTTFLGLIAVLIGMMLPRRSSYIQKTNISFEYRF